MALSSDLNLNGQKTPIFLIPDIFGDEAVYENILLELEALGYVRGQTVFVWHDKRYDEHKSSNNPPSVLELAQLIAKGILQKFDNLPKHMPVMLGAYSFGTTLAIEVIKILKAQGKTVFTYMLDGVPAPLSRDYFQPEKVNATKDLISIIHLCARKSGIISDKTPEEMFSEEEVRRISALPSIKAQLKAIKTKYIAEYVAADDDDISDESLLSFNQTRRIACQNLESLAQYCEKPPLPTEAPDGLMVGMTINTLQKHEFAEEKNSETHFHVPDASWGSFYGLESAEFSIPPKSHAPVAYSILRGTHTELPDHKHAGAVAASMDLYFRVTLEQYNERLAERSRRPIPLVIEVTPAQPASKTRHPNTGIDLKYSSPGSPMPSFLGCSPTTDMPKFARDSSIGSSPSTSPKSAGAGSKPSSRRSTPASSPLPQWASDSVSEPEGLMSPIRAEMPIVHMEDSHRPKFASKPRPIPQKPRPQPRQFHESSPPRIPVGPGVAGHVGIGVKPKPQQHAHYQQRFKVFKPSPQRRASSEYPVPDQTNIRHFPQ